MIPAVPSVICYVLSKEMSRIETVTYCIDGYIHTLLSGQCTDTIGWLGRMSAPEEFLIATSASSVQIYAVNRSGSARYTLRNIEVQVSLAASSWVLGLHLSELEICGTYIGYLSLVAYVYKHHRFC